MDDNYIPIDCGLHDRLELLAMRGRPVRLCVWDDDGEVREVEDRLVTIQARGGVERLVTAGGEEIRLDRLVSVDGVDFGGAAPGDAASRRVE